MKFLLSFLLIGFLVPPPPPHQFHVSKATLRYVSEREQVQLEFHIFLDDLEKALLAAGAPKLYIGTDTEMPQTPRHLAAYLEKHFKLTWNGKPLPVGLLGYELSDDLQALWIYAQAKTREDLRSIGIQNSLLTEIYDDQKNIVKVEAGDKSTTLLTSHDRTEAKHSW